MKIRLKQFKNNYCHPSYGYIFSLLILPNSPPIENLLSIMSYSVNSMNRASIEFPFIRSKATEAG